jgi:hypothetical protein
MFALKVDTGYIFILLSFLYSPQATALSDLYAQC